MLGQATVPAVARTPCGCPAKTGVEKCWEKMKITGKNWIIARCR